jgi:hypothetical protein
MSPAKAADDIADFILARIAGGASRRSART